MSINISHERDKHNISTITHTGGGKDTVNLMRSSIPDIDLIANKIRSKAGSSKHTASSRDSIGSRNDNNRIVDDSDNEDNEEEIDAQKLNKSKMDTPHNDDKSDISSISSISDDDKDKDRHNNNNDDNDNVNKKSDSKVISSTHASGDDDDDHDRDRSRHNDHDEDDKTSHSGTVQTMISMTPEQRNAEKQKYLFKLRELSAKYGLKPSRQYDMRDSLEDIKSEHDVLKKLRDTEQAIKVSRRILLAFTGLVEMGNEKFDPVGAKLDGWSNNMAMNIDDYDEVFAELYDKYSEQVALPPEIKLMMMVGGSAVQYHMTKLNMDRSNLLNGMRRPPMMMAHNMPSTNNIDMSSTNVDDLARELGINTPSNSQPTAPQAPSQRHRQQRPPN